MYKKSSTGWLKHLDFMILDVICLQFAFVFGYWFRHHSINPYGSTIYRNEAIVFALIQIMIMFFDDSFKNVMKRGYLVEIGKTVKNMIYIIVLGVFYLFLIQEGDQFSRVTIILTGIIFLFVAPAIYIKSPGPIFFSQYRVGKNGRKFKIYKFRSMYMDAEERKKELMKQNRVSDGLMFKMENDPRVIGSEKGPGKGIGNFIRKTSLDEFPQFFNVLKGDMSLVGEWDIIGTTREITHISAACAV